LNSFPDDTSNINNNQRIILRDPKKGIVRNTVINLINRLILIPVGILAIPLILHGMGTERFSIFSLTWTLLNYFAVLDFGLSQGATKFIAAELNKGEKDAIPNIFWTSLLIMVGIGIIISTGMALLSPWLVNSILHPPQILASESIRMFQFLGFSIPFVFLNNSLRGSLEANLRFDLVNAVRTPYSALIYLSPLFGYIIGFQIDRLTELLFFVVILANLIYLLICAQIYPNIFHKIKFRGSLLRALLSYSGWVAISNFISPILVYLDRFLISGIYTVSVLAYYTAPYEALTRLWFIPMSLTATLFPVFSRDNLEVDQFENLNRLIITSFKYILLILGPITAFILLFPREILNLWLGSDFASTSAMIAQLLSIGILFNSLGRLPATLLYGRGHPDIPAKLYMIELPIYTLIAFVCLKIWGINGAALAWMIRVGADAVLLFLISSRHKDIRLNIRNKQLIIAALSLLGVYIIGIAIRYLLKDISWLYQVWVFLIPILTFAVISWLNIFNNDERTYFKHYALKFWPKRKRLVTR
jgi:O-antigen/teichoic acid export membrane protein